MRKPEIPLQGLGFAFILAAAFTNPSLIKFNANTTGSVSRSLASKLSDTVSVLDFGADPTGVSDSTAAIQAAITALGASGGVVWFPLGTYKTTSTVSLTVTSGKTLLIDLGGSTWKMSHASGNGLTVNGGLLRGQQFGIRNGTISGNSTASVVGVKWQDVLYGTMRDVVFTGFTGSNQTALLLDNSQDNTFDMVVFEGNNGTGTIALSLTDNANANKYSALQFSDGYQAIAIGNGASGNWFSDCLVQSNAATNAVTIKSLTADAGTSILNTTFERCWFENNGDGTANSTSVSFTADAARIIANTTFSDTHFNGNTNGALGVAFRFAGAGTTGGFNLLRTRNRYQGYASVFSGLATAGGGVSVMDNDTTATNVADVDVGGVNHGINFAPQGAAKKFQIYAGFPSDNDGRLRFMDSSLALEILRYGGTWTFTRDLNFSGARVTYSRTTPTYGASITINSSLGDVFEIVATNGTAFTVANPTNAAGASQRIVIRIKNTSGGALGVLTWDTLYKAPAWTQPANGFSRTAEFYFDGTNWIQMWQSAADVPN